MRGEQNSSGHIPDLADMSMWPSSSEMVTTALIEEKLVHFFEHHLICCLLGHIALVDGYALCGIVQSHGRGHSRICCAPLTSLLQQESLQGPRVPKRRLLRSGLVPCFCFWSSCPTSLGTSTFPRRDMFMGFLSPAES